MVVLAQMPNSIDAPRGTMRYRCPDITVHGKTRIATDGKNAHILDDEGKDRKVPVIERSWKKTKSLNAKSRKSLPCANKRQKRRLDFF
jgi:hypothetical protein